MNYSSAILVCLSFSSLPLLSGTTYFQVDEGLLIISGMCVFSTSSALFMFPAMYPYYTRALEVYKFERADGVGKAYDLVIQGFVRFAFLALFPVIFAATAIYLLVSSVSFVAFLFLSCICGILCISLKIVNHRSQRTPSLILSLFFTCIHGILCKFFFAANQS